MGTLPPMPPQQKGEETHQTQQMQSTITILRPLHTLHNIWRFMELPLLDGHVDADDILPNNTSSTDIQMPSHFRKIRTCEMNPRE
jgi:uncharacterized membrane protein